MKKSFHSTPSFQKSRQQPPEQRHQQRQKESEDELNDATFGEAAFADIGNEFKFASPRALQSETFLGDLDPAITLVRRGEIHSPVVASSQAGGFEHYEDNGEERPPGMDTSPPAATTTTKRTMTLDEIEAKFGQTTLRPSQQSQSRWFQPKSKKATIISFPDAEILLEDASGDSSSHRGAMTRFEREGVARIHLAQLSTEHAEIEDFYYRAYAKRISSRRAGDASIMNTAPLYLPLPTPKHQQSQKTKSSSSSSSSTNATAAAVKEALASALGKKSASSSKRPRQQLSVPPAVAGKVTSIYSVTASIELIYQIVFKVEDALANESDTEYDLQYLQEVRREAIALIDRELYLEMSIGEVIMKEAPLARFLNLLTLPKAKKILGRAIKAIDSVNLSERLLGRLVDLFEYLDVCRVDASEADVNLFVNCLLASLVPYVAKRCGWPEVLDKLRVMGSKSSLAWIVGTKAGLVLLCILISRVEILKTESSAVAEAEWMTLVEKLFEQLQDRLADLFGNLRGVDSEFYGWQFMALLALNVDADRKRVMVMELRERILQVAQSGDPKSIDNLNIFLNALGLDASQLAL